MPEKASVPAATIQPDATRRGNESAEAEVVEHSSRVLHRGRLPSFAPLKENKKKERQRSGKTKTVANKKRAAQNSVFCTGD